MATLSDKAGFLIAANFIKYAVGFTLPMLMVRLLDKADYGTYQQLLLVNSMALGLLTMGLPSSIFYFYNRQADAAKSALVVQTLAMLCIAGAVAAVGIAVATPAIATQTSNPALGSLLPLYAVAIGLMLAGEHFTSFMVAQDRYGAAVGFETFETLVRVLTLIAPIALGYGMQGLVVAAVLYAAGRFIVRSLWVMRTGRHPVRSLSAARAATFVPTQLAYSIPLWLTSIVGVAGGMLDRAIVAGAFKPIDFAIYSVGAFAVPLDVIFQASVADVLRATLPPLVQRGDLAEVARLLREAVRKLALIMLPSFVFLFGFADEFITLLFTNQYADSVHVFRIYLFGLPLFMFVLSLIPQVFGWTGINLKIVIASTVLHVILSFTLLKTVGFYGPALSSVISSYLSVAIYLWVALKLTKAPLPRLVPLPEIAKTFACAAVGLAAAWMAGTPAPTKLFNLVLHGALFTVVFFAAGVLSGLFTPQDRALARRWAAKLRPARHAAAATGENP
jgi:O-antigen/teichoic acid export membrane protein